MKREHDIASAHPYMPTGAQEIRSEMLKEVGANSLEDLVSDIPEKFRFRGKMNIPEPLLSESDLKRHVESIMGRNISCADYTSFLGAGCYRHYVPAVCDEINGRAEFLTAYVGDTYSDHGKMQAFFEYCSLMAELLEMDVVSYTTFDGGQAACSALRMALKITGRKKLLVPSTINPEVLSQLRDYSGHLAEIVTIDHHPETAGMELDILDRELDSETAAVYIENPSYLGFLEQNAGQISALAHSRGALSVVSADPISLGVMTPPTVYGADIACGDIQSLGLHMHYGGGCAGYIATPDEERFVASYPTYIYGITRARDDSGFGWGRAFNWRTSHGSREKANEYMGTAAGLWAITAAVYLALMGPQGMKETGTTILARTEYARRILGEIKGIRIDLISAPHFREVAVNFDDAGLSAGAVNRSLLDRGIFGGKDLSEDFPWLGQSALYCFTEATTADDIDRLADAIDQILNSRGGKLR